MCHESVLLYVFAFHPRHHLKPLYEFQGWGCTGEVRVTLNGSTLSPLEDRSCSLLAMAGSLAPALSAAALATSPTSVSTNIEVAIKGPDRAGPTLCRCSRARTWDLIAQQLVATARRAARTTVGGSKSPLRYCSSQKTHAEAVLSMSGHSHGDLLFRPPYPKRGPEAQSKASLLVAALWQSGFGQIKRTSVDSVRSR